MNITEVRIKTISRNGKKLLAFGSITIDDAFVIRDLKIVRGANGAFVAMPSRKLTDRCHKCKCKNHLRASYCNDCGAKLRHERTQRDQDGRRRLYMDIAHPINASCRDEVQQKVLAAFEEMEKQPSAKTSSNYDDYDDYDDYENSEDDTTKPDENQSQDKDDFDNGIFT